MTPPGWEDAARDELADAWVAATPDERDLIETIVLGVERHPARDPYAVGESRDGPDRVLIRPSLSFWYTVSGDRANIFRVVRHRPRTL